MLKIVHKNRIPTPEARDLGKALEDLGIKVITEFDDGHKRIDLVIREARLNVEVDGIQHLTDPNQILADLNRDYYSSKRGYRTMHIPNVMIRSHLKEISVALAQAVRIREQKICIHLN